MRVFLALALVAAALSGCAEASEPFDPVQSIDDSDGDGYIDAVEAKYGSDPMNATSVPDVMVHEDIQFSGSGMMMAAVESPLDGCGAQGSIDVVTLKWLIEAPANTTKHHVMDLVFTAHLPQTMAELDIYVFDPSGKDLTPGTTTMTVPPQRTDSISIDGKHPVGEYTIELRGCAGTGNVQLDATGVLGYEPDADSLLAADEHEHAEESHDH